MTTTTKIIIVAAIVLLLTTATAMGVSAKGLNFIKDFEGERLKSYRDTGNIWTIGFGSTYNHDAKRKVQEGDIIDKETALRWLRLDAGKFATGVKKLVKVPINQNQLDSLTSFAYNLGEGALRSSTLLKKVNANPLDAQIRNEFQKWIYADGKKLNGLLRRRNAEADLYFS